MGISNIDKSTVSRICAELDGVVTQWRNRPLGECEHLWLDAKYLKVRDGRVVSKALIVAYAVRSDGYRAILGCELAETESRATYKAFLRSLKERGLSGVKLVISDAHVGLREAIEEEMLGGLLHPLRDTTPEFPWTSLSPVQNNSGAPQCVAAI